MIVCRKCRANNMEGDAFCGSCGAFLEWTGEKVDLEPEAVREEEVPADPGRKKTLVEKMRGVVETAVSPSGPRVEKGEAWTGFGKEAAGGAAPGPGSAGGAPAPPGRAAGPPAPPSRPSAAPTGQSGPPTTASSTAPPKPPPRPPGAAGAAGPPKPPPRPPGAAGAAGPPKPPPKPPPRPPAGRAAGPPKPPPLPGADTATDVLAPAAPMQTSTDETVVEDEVEDGGVLPTRELARQDTSGLLVPVEGDATRGTADGEPAEVVPQRAPKRIAPVTKTKPTRRLKPGDLICGQCGEGNPATRKFCSRCGDELASAEVVKNRWWHKLLRRKPKVMEAGARPGQPGAKTGMGARAKAGWRAAFKVFTTCMITVTIVSAFVPAVREPVDKALGHPIDRVKDWWANLRDPYSRVVPVGWDTNRIPEDGHPAQEAFDNNTESYWATVWKPNERLVATRLTVEFSEPVEDLVVFVYGGAPGDAFTMYHAPSEIRFDYGDGRPNDTMTLPREEGASPVFELEHADGVTEIDIWIEGVHSQKEASYVAISEFEFKQKE